MKLNNLLLANALLFLALGIAFALYGPLMMAFFSFPELLENNVMAYWITASFVRLFGAALFGLGLLLWAVQGAIKEASPAAQRSVLAAMLLANGMAAFVALTQQVSIWQSTAGWVTCGLFLLLVGVYLYALVFQRSTSTT